MTTNWEIKHEAASLSKDERKKVLLSFKEVKLYPHLKSLLYNMDPDSMVEITHGPDELGKDLVMIREDKFGKNVIGIVVKTGDIRGKTVGKVDEIISQINQCLSHPAQVKSFSDPQKITVVWVILAGELSNQARKRMLKEANTTNLQIYDLNWLIKNFTEYYPNIFFEGRAMDSLQIKILDLESKHMFYDRGTILTDCFVEPLVSAIDIPLTFDEDSFSLIVRNKKMPFSRLSTIIEKEKKVILTGDPGTGKSTALAKLAIDGLRKASKSILRGKKDHSIDIPVFISSLDLLCCSNVDEFIERQIPKPELRDRFRINAILVDGLDEAAPETREIVIKRATDFSDQIKCSLIITSRKIDLIKSAPPNFSKYELLTFEIRQAITLIEKIVSDNAILTSLKEGLEKIKHQISLTPLSLNLLIELAESHREIPASITELYERFSDMVLGRYDQEKGITILFEYLIKKRFLSSIAFEEFYKKGRLEIDRIDFEEYLGRYASLYGWDKELLNNFMNELERSGILGIQDKISFCHRSFLDYFIAQYLFDNREMLSNLENIIIELYYDDVWADVAFFYIGLRRDIQQSTLEKIFNEADGDLGIHIQKLLTGRLLQAAWHATKETKIFGLKNAIKYSITTRDKFIYLAEKADHRIPQIYADIFVMVLADFSFGSGFLKDEIEYLFDGFRDNPTQDNLYGMLTFLWATQKYINPDEMKEKTEIVLDVMINIPELNKIDESIALLLLESMEEQDKTIEKVIRKRLKKMAKKYPKLFREILPLNLRKNPRVI